MLLPWSVAIEPTEYSAGGKKLGPYQLLLLYIPSRENTKNKIVLTAISPHTLALLLETFCVANGIDIKSSPIIIIVDEITTP